MGRIIRCEGKHNFGLGEKFLQKLKITWCCQKTKAQSQIEIMRRYNCIQKAERKIQKKHSTKLKINFL